MIFRFDFLPFRGFLVKGKYTPVTRKSCTTFNSFYYIQEYSLGILDWKLEAVVSNHTFDSIRNFFAKLGKLDIF